MVVPLLAFRALGERGKRRRWLASLCRSTTRGSPLRVGGVLAGLRLAYSVGCAPSHLTTLETGCRPFPTPHHPLNLNHGPLHRCLLLSALTLVMFPLNPSKLILLRSDTLWLFSSPPLAMIENNQGLAARQKYWGPTMARIYIGR